MVTLEILGSRGVNGREKEELSIGRKAIENKEKGKWKIRGKEN